MIIKLFHPPANNWLLVAEQLDDPANWDRFIPCHTIDSQRWQFDSTVKHTAAVSALKVKPCKELLVRGMSVFEYDWECDDDLILAHAIHMAEHFDTDLLLEAPVGLPSRFLPTAA